MTGMAGKLFFAGLALAALVSWLQPGPLRAKEKRTNVILAMTDDQRLLTHNDEAGIVYEVDFEQGKIVKSFGLVNRGVVISDDFEGIAAAEGLIYMVTSTGRVFEFSEGADGERVSFRAYDSGVGRACEIEGLAYEPRERALLLLCKNPRVRELAGPEF